MNAPRGAIQPGETYIPFKGGTQEQFDHDVTYYSAGGVMAMGKLIRAGQVLVQHRHAYEHLSILAYGTIIVELDGESKTITGPACLTIPANKHHGVRALTDCLWYCIHAESISNEIVSMDGPAAHAIAKRLKGE